MAYEAQRGRRAVQARRPRRISAWWANTHSSSGKVFCRSSSTRSGLSCRLNASLRASLPTCVSTAMAGTPNSTPRTTLAVLRPTPGSSMSSSRVPGTCPPCLSRSRRAVATMLRALLRNSPIEIMSGITSSGSAPASASASGNAANSAGVARFTPSSVACAERITAMSSSNGVVQSSSVSASPYSARSSSRMSAARRRLFFRDSRGKRRRGAVAFFLVIGSHHRTAARADVPARKRGTGYNHRQRGNCSTEIRGWLMPVFEYKARDRSGKVFSATMEAATPRDVAEALREKGFFVTEIKEPGRGLNADIKLPKWLDFGSRPGLRDVTIFSRQFATVINAGLPVVQSLSILQRQAEKEGMKDALKAVREDVETGLPLSDSLAKFPAIFNRLYVYLVRAGEASGNLDGILERVAAYQEKQMELRGKKIGRASCRERVRG